MQRRFFKSQWLQDLFTLEEPRAAPRGGGGAAGGAGGRRHSAQSHSETQQLFGDADITAAEQIAEAEVLEDVRVEEVPQAAGEDGQAAKEGGATGKADNARVLRSLFESGEDGDDGVCGALSHDRVMDTDGIDDVLVRRQAHTIATQAMRELAQSRASRSRSSIAVPTWTGRSGEAGMQRRAPVGRTVDDRAAASEAAMASMTKEVIGMFDAAGDGGQLGSAELVQAFRARLKTARQNALFKQVLKTVAVLDKRSKKWQLR